MADVEDKLKREYPGNPDTGDASFVRDPACQKECAWGDTYLCPLYSKCMRGELRAATHDLLREKAKQFLGLE